MFRRRKSIWIWLLNNIVGDIVHAGVYNFYWNHLKEIQGGGVI